MVRKCRIFLSWSGKASHQLAEQLHEWLPNVIQVIEPYLSQADTAKGERWLERISAELADASLGILCLTRSNLESPWLLFEAGALSQKFEPRQVCPFLLNLAPTDLTFPLAQFQATTATEGDVRRLMTTINDTLGDDRLNDKKLSDAFEVWWPKLKTAISSIKDDSDSDAESSELLRTDRELLEETLTLVRGINFRLPPITPPRRPRATLVSCPNCGERALRLGDDEPRCTKCDWSDPPEEAADAYARAGDADWRHPKHGPDDELGICSACGYDAVAPLQERDQVGRVQQKIGSIWRRLQLEPGAGDAGYSVCFACGEIHYGGPRAQNEE
jgi:hypothetical protein